MTKIKRTSIKREYVDMNYPTLTDFIEKYSSVDEYRMIDKELQKVDDVIALQYTITLLCDKLTELTNDNLTED